MEILFLCSFVKDAHFVGCEAVEGIKADFIEFAGGPESFFVVGAPLQLGNACQH